MTNVISIVTKFIWTMNFTTPGTQAMIRQPCHCCYACLRLEN